MSLLDLEDGVEENYELTLTKDGKIIRREWEYNDELREGKYVFTDVSDDLLNVINKIAKIEHGFTLGHLCNLLQKDYEIIDLLMKNCFIKDFIPEYQRIMHSNYIQPISKYDPDGVEYLNLYWHCEMDGEYIWGMDRPDFDGQGWELREEKIEEWGSYPKGHCINWGIDFMPMEEILHLPIVADESVEVYEDLSLTKARFNESDPESYKQRVLFKCKKKYTLKNIIEGIFWELSFYGAPEDKAEQKKELDSIMEEVNKAIEFGDTSKFISVEKLIDELGVPEDKS